MSSIRLINIAKHYGTITAVDDISLTVGEGELATILGPSGSGKTTVLALIAGLSDPTCGQIWIGGRDVTWLPAAKRNVGLVVQSYALFPHMSVFDNIAFPLTVRRVGKPEIERRVKEALQLVRLSGFEHRRPGQLSGGQQQRVALARAVVFKPDILLLDEPLGALDRKLREEVQVELRQLQRSLGITTILVTHDQEEALSLSDRIVVLCGGQVQQIGAPAEVYLRPSNRFVAEFLGAANFLEGIVEPAQVSWRIRLASGETVPCAPPTGSTPGHPVSAIVRPERVMICPTETSEGLPAKVSAVTYLGHFIRYHLETLSGKAMVAASIDRGIRHAPGDLVKLSWMPEDVWIVPASNGRLAGMTVDVLG